MLRVLVPSDGSDFAIAAARRGLSLLPAEARATVITVVPLISPVLGVPTMGSGDGTVFDPQTLRETQDARVASASAGLDATVAALGVGAAGRLEHGDPAAIICEVADREGFDLIVLGSHGAGLLKRALLGSVSHHVLHHAACPVLVVRGAEAQSRR